MKKKLIRHSFLLRKECKKLLLMIKLFSILMFATIVSSATNVYSQKVRVNLNLQNASLEKVFEEIQDQTEFDFFYKNEQLPSNKTISRIYKNVKIDQVLDDVLEGTGLVYHLLNKDIVITYRKVSDSEKAEPVLGQQTKTITGKVTDDSGVPLPGVTIVIKGTTQGTITNIDGIFSLEIPKDRDVLTFSYLGFKSQDVMLDGKVSLNIEMKPDVIGLDEVVAIGYGVAKKSDLTGAITQVKADDLRKFSPSNVSDFLRNTVPGLNVEYATSAKGNSSLEIRGQTTLTAGSSPLIVLDGVIYNGDISDINPDDIDRMDILKDASSAAVYGSRATNGVIVITTRRGESDKPTISFNSTVGISTSGKRLKPYDAEGFIQWRSDMFKSVYSATVPSDLWSPYDDPRTLDAQYLDAWLDYHSTTEDNMVDAWLSGLRLTGIEIENYKAGKTYDWGNDIFHNGFRQDYNISLSGKKTNFSYYWSLGYMNNEALTIGDEFSVIRSRVNLEGQVAKFLKVGLNAQFSYRDESSVPVSEDQYRNLTPYSSYYTDDGTQLRLYPNDDNQAMHPLLISTYRDREQEYYTLLPKIYSVIELPFGITYTMNFSPRVVFYHNYIHDSSEHPLWGLYGGSASRNNRIDREWQFDNIINWKHTFSEVHKVDVTLLANAEKFRRNSDGMSNRYFTPNDLLGYHDMSTGTLPSIWSYDEVETADALMARLNYGYKNKYMATLSVRRDGSSLFGYSNPRATFPAAALGWVVSEEDFFSSDIIDYLKFRASWGTNGNRNISNYAALSRIATGKALNAAQNGDAYTVSTLSISTMANKALKWEETEALNIGMDFNLWDGTLSGSVEAYNMSTSDVLVNRELPTITGFERVYANLGEVKNKGLEITLNSTNIKRRNFEWNTNFIFSLNRNKIESITGEQIDVYDTNGNVIGQKEPDDIDNWWFIGQEIGTIWDYKIQGTWKVGEEVEAAKWGQAPGDFKLEDLNDDGLLTDDDKQFLGHTSPRFRWTMTNNFRFNKNFEASILIYSLWGHKGSFWAAKHEDATEDRRNSWDIPYWTPENQTNDFARLRSAPAQGVSYNVWFDRSYIRIGDIAIAYTLPKSVIDRTFVKTCKISASVKNAGVWAPDWKFGDPEDETLTQRIFSLGVNLTL